MTIAWRLVNKKVLHSAFTGEGALVAGGRWNPKGLPVIYMSESLALASLELFARLQKKNRDNLFLAIPVMIPDDISIESLSPRDLPIGWRNFKDLSATQEIGRRWAQEQRSAVLRVPSVIAFTGFKADFNLVANPHHRDFSKIKPGNPEPFTFDPRFWK